MLWNKKQTEQFLDNLFTNTSTGYLQISCIKPGFHDSKFFPFPLKYSDVEQYIDKYVGKTHIFFSVNPRKDTKGYGTNEQVGWLTAFWVDIDAKQHDNDMKIARDNLKRFQLEPTVLVNSGNGYHAYWVLEKPIKIDNNNRNDLTAVSTALHKFVKADSTKDLRRILRVAGTPNIKKNGSTQEITSDDSLWKMCNLERVNYNYYTLQQIKDNLPNLDEVEQDKTKDVKLNLNDVVGFSDFEEFCRILEGKIGETKANELISNIKTIPAKLQGDRSTNDFRVTVQLYDLGFNDAEILEIFQIARSKGFELADKFIEKGDKGLDYLTLTMKKAKIENNKLYALIDELDNAPDSIKLTYLPKIYEYLMQLNTIEQQVKLREIHAILGGNKKITFNLLQKDYEVYKLNSNVDKNFFEVTEKGRVHFVTEAMANYILEKQEFMNLGGTLYRYAHGVYKNDGDIFLEQLIQDLLGKEWEPSRSDAVVKYILTKTSTDYKDLPEIDHLINVKNGMYNVETGEILPHSPEYRSLVQLNVEYEKNATSEILDNFVSSIFPEEEIPILWEYMGYIIYSKLELKKLMILVGDGHNGKSKFIRLVEEVIGDDNISHEPLQELTNNKFALGNLFGKVLNSYADLSQNSLEDTDKIKLLTGDDKIRGEFKFKTAFYFDNTARNIFSCNILPSITHYDAQFFDRLLILRCPYRFEIGKNADMNILDKVLTEDVKKAFLNKAIAGINRLRINKTFTYSPMIQRETNQYRYSNDSVSDFLHQHVREKLDQNVWVSKSVMYDEYVEFCKHNGRMPLSSQKFSFRAKDAPHFLKEFRPFDSKKNKQVYAWKDVELVNPTKLREVNLK